MATMPNVTYNITFRGLPIHLDGLVKASFNEGFNKIHVVYNSDISLNKYQVRVTDINDDNYNPDYGELVYQNFGSISANTNHSYDIIISSEHFHTDGVYRVGLYARSAIDNTWDATWIYMIFNGQGHENYRVSPDHANYRVVAQDSITKIDVPTVSGTFIYNGTELSALIGSYDTNLISVSGTLNATDAGSYNIVFHLIDNTIFHWKDDSIEDKVLSWEIGRKSISIATVTLGESLTYNGEELSLTIEYVIIDGLNVTYDVSGNSQTNAGSYVLTCSGNGNFIGIVQKNWSIAKAQGSVIPPTVKELVYNGNNQTLVNAGSSDTGTIQYKIGLGGDYSTELPVGKDATSYSVYYRVIGDLNHKDIAESHVNVSISQLEAMLNWGTLSWTYDGNIHSTACAVSNIVLGDICNVTLSGNNITDAGSTIVTASSLSNINYKLPTNNTATLIVNRASVGAKPSTTVNKTYNRVLQTNDYTVPNGVSMTGNSYGTNAGTYIATYTPDANHMWSDSTTSEVSCSLVIVACNLSSCTIETPSAVTYNGSAQKPTPSVKHGSTSLSSSTEFTYSYSNNTNAGTATVTATGKGNYTGTKSANFTINRASVGNKPSTSVSKTYNGSALNNGYTTPGGVTMTGNNSGTNVGTYTATYTPDGNHCWSDSTTGSVTVTLTISKANATMTKPTAKTGLVYFSSDVILINAGSASGGTIYYGLGSSTTSAPSSWSTSLPTGKNGTYYVWSKVTGDSNHNDVSQSYACTVSVASPKRVGGRIFYDNGSNGATYTFYNSSGSVISTQTVSGLANAYYYTVSGTPTKDRWYVFDNTTRVDPYSGYNVTKGLLYRTFLPLEYIFGEVYWGLHLIETKATANSIGSGKTNTNLVLTNFGVPKDYTPNIWGYVKRMRDDNYLGCNDWFIASMAEQDKLRASGLVTWYNSMYIWTSVEKETDPLYVYYWSVERASWQYLAFKDDGLACFAARAF